MGDFSRGVRRKREREFRIENLEEVCEVAGGI